MKIKLPDIKVIGILLLSVCTNTAMTQNPTTFNRDNNEVERLINQIADSLEYYYVDAAVGKQIGDYLKTNLSAGIYTEIKEADKLAKQLTEDLRTINGDLHLYVNYHDRNEQQNEQNEPDNRVRFGAGTNYGFQEIKFFEGNIAYLKISHFSSWHFANQARQKITDLMPLFNKSEAFIIDVRDNRGGVPYIASFLASYFFGDEPVHLADFYTRFNDSRYGIYTEPLVPGKQFPEVPVFILVNNKTASAGEELAFWLQNQKRATIIGTNTAGAGHGALMHQLTDNFSISISSEVEIDPVTQKGFQGSGVVPDVVTSDSAAYSTALMLAQKAIRSPQLPDSTKLSQFYKRLKNKETEVNETDLFERVILLHQEGLLNYNAINDLGYQYLNEPDKAVPILRANTILYSFYPNPFDSYAEALAQAGLFEAALQNYNNAVLLARIKNNPNLNQFKRNRTNFLIKYNPPKSKN